MRIENKVIPEGINSSDEHPLKEFALLTSGIVGTFVAVVIVISMVAGFLAPLVPFSWEKKIATQYQGALLQQDSGNTTAPARRQLTLYLQQLADRIAKVQALPSDISITVHYIDSDTVNAFATLGGNIVVFRGLLEKLHDENALAWVMGHEIAHIKNRDPIKSIGRGAVIGIVMSIAGIATGNDMVENVLGQSGLLTVLKFSREQEEKADIDALYSLHDLYGHAGSATEFLEEANRIQEESGGRAFEFLESHPLTENRISRIKEVIRDDGWESNGKITPLPEDIFHGLENKADAS